MVSPRFSDHGQIDMPYQLFSSLRPQASVSRRSFLIGSGATALLTAVPGLTAQATSETQPLRSFKLRPGKASAQLVGGSYPATPVWAYNSVVPGPEIRVTQGDRVRIAVENALDEETTVHWHGLRVPHDMDGVPHLTQVPIGPNKRFVYEFDVPDAGTYWYHPHQRGFEQVGRGLYGPLIIEEREPIIVDRDVTWVLDDWRLERDARISNDFANRHDMSHNGRVGNTVTINGQIPGKFQVRQGERIRLRLINAANARIFALNFDGHQPWVVALDGQPVTPHEPNKRTVVLGPAMRVDLVLDMTGDPGTQFTTTDTFYQGLEYKLVDVVYGSEPLRSGALDSPIELPANSLPEPLMAGITRHQIRFTGGMMGGGMMGGGSNMMSMMREGKMWFINGVAATGHVMDPLLTLERDRSYLIEMVNDTAWHHPIHLHGHSFRVVSRNGKPMLHQEWQDTVLMAPKEIVEIALVADNPGDWMFHCHILEHQAAGMMGIIRVST